MEEPAFIGSVSFEPLDGFAGHIPGHVQPHLAAVVDFIETGVPVPGAVPLPKGADGHDALDARRSQRGHPAGLDEGVPKPAFGAFIEGGGSPAAVIDNPGAQPAAASPQRCPGR
jgi:hypothetical protein